MYLKSKMAGDEVSSKVLKVSTSCISKCKIRYRNKYKRNRNRNLRRKKSRLKYIENIRNLTTEKRSQELCSSLSVFNIADMHSIQEDHSLKPPEGVAEWQYHHQLAYWKSRAISLEYENRMLHTHIKNMCTQELQNYVDFVKNPNESNCIEDNIKTSSQCETELNTENIGDVEENGTRNDMKMLYGEMESKISAMETAMKVNYKMQIDRHNPQVWPNIPLNM